MIVIWFSNRIDSIFYVIRLIILHGAKYSRMDQVELFKGCLPQILLGLFLNTLPHISAAKRLTRSHKIDYRYHFHNIYSLAQSRPKPPLLYVLMLPIRFSLQIKNISQKQPSRGVLRKSSENIQQIYRETRIPNRDFNKIALQLYWNQTLALVFLL